MTTKPTMNDVFSHFIVHIRSYLLVGLIFLIIAIAYAHLTTPLFTASLSIAEEETNFTGGGQLIGMSDDIFSGFGFGSNEGSPDYQKFILTLTSREVAERVFSDDAVRKKIFGAQWDEDSDEWKHKNGFVSTSLRLFKIAIGYRLDARRTSTDFAEYLSKNVLIDRVGNRPVHKISFTHSDPGFAKKFLTSLVTQADMIIREKSKVRNDHDRQYIQDLFKNQTPAEVRHQLSRIYASLEYKSMALNSPNPVFITVLDRAAVSTTPTHPRPLFYIFIAILFTIFIGFIYSLISVLLNPSANEDNSIK